MELLKEEQNLYHVDALYAATINTTN